MCFGSPSPPQVVRTGPSQAEIDAQAQSLATYRSQMQQQQTAFQQQLQQQIDSANAETTALRSRYEQDSAAAAAAAAAQQAGSYAVTASQTEAPPSAQTTEMATRKEKPQSKLRISMAGLPSSAGTGLNIGV